MSETLSETAGKVVWFELGRRHNLALGLLNGRSWAGGSKRWRSDGVPRDLRGRR